MVKQLNPKNELETTVSTLIKNFGIDKVQEVVNSHQNKNTVITEAIQSEISEPSKISQSLKKVVTTNNDSNIKLQTNNLTLRLLLDISNSFFKYDNTSSFLNFILKRTIEVFEGVKHGSVLLLDEDGYCRFVAAAGFDFEELSKIKLHYTKTFLYDYTKGLCDRAILVNNTSTRFRQNPANKEIEAFHKKDATDIMSTLTAPISIDDKLIGIIAFDSMTVNAFLEADISIIDYISKQISVYLKNFMLYKQTVYSSKYDELTGLYNRAYFNKQLFKLQSQCVSTDAIYSIAVIDLNGLKQVNDLHGHLAGDELLKVFSNTLFSSLRKKEIMGRTGGDEFMLLLPETSREEGEAFLKKIHQQIEGMKVTFEDLTMRMSYSYGIAEYKKDGLTSKDIIRIADQRMYEHKHTF